MPPIHNPEIFQLSEEGKRRLSMRLLLMALIVLAAVSAIPLGQYLRDDKWRIEGFIGPLVVLLIIVARFWPMYRYLLNFELTLNEKGITVGRNLELRQMFYEDIARIVRTKKHLVIQGRYPEQVIVIPASLNDFDRVERILQAVMPFTISDERLPVRYAQYLYPPGMRRRSPFFIFLGVAFFSLITALLFNRPNFPVKVKHTVNNIHPVSFSAEDSLERYSRTDSLIQGDDYAFYSGVIDNLDVGVYQRMKNVCLVFKKNGHWNFSDSIRLPVSALYTVEHPDLNGDHHDDLIIYGESENDNNEVVFLFYPQVGKFMRNTFYELPEVSYDSVARRVHADSWNDTTGVEDKRSYRIVGDSLTAEEGVTFLPDTAENSDKATVEFYAIKNGKRNVTRTYHGKYEPMYALFQKSLWISGGEDED